MNELILLILAIFLLVTPRFLLKKLPENTSFKIRIILSVIFLLLIWMLERDAKLAPKLLLTAVIGYNLYSLLKQHFFKRESKL